MEHPSEPMTMVHGRGEPNSLPGSDLDYSRKVHDLEDFVSFEKVLPGEQQSCFCVPALSSLKGYSNSVRSFSVLAVKTVLMVANIYWTDQLSRSGTLLSGPSV